MRHQLALALLLASSTAACVDSAAPSDPSADPSQVDQADGGYTTADEAPMFGASDEFDAAAIEADTPVADTMAQDQTVVAMAGAPSTDGRDVILVWGRIPGQPLAQQGRDWSGQLQISRGALIVGRTIGFEDRTDHLLPRTSKDTVPFASVTKPFVDGLALRVLDPTPAATDPLTLTYTSADGATTYSLDLAQLATGPLVVDAGDGFKVVAAAVRDNDSCEHGFMRGRWHQVTQHLGVYRGLVVGPEGAIIGHVRGIYGQRQNGDRVMFGKFIDDAGHFKGILAGTYGSGDFAAKWITKDGDHGLVKGKYIESPNVAGGLFAAKWADSACQ
jgi:hypothetical protein